MSRKFLWIALGSVVSICAFFVFEYMSFSFFAVNKGLFCSVIEERNLEEKLSIPSEQLKQAANSMIDYVRLWEKDDSLQVTVTKNGTNQDFFTDSEIRHVEDVRVLMCNIRIVIFCMTGMIALLLPLFIKKKKSVELCYGYFLSIIILLAVVLVVAVVAVVDINVFITAFHKLLFDNDGWIMNPAREKIVFFFPDSLYQKVLARMLVCTICFFATATGFAVKGIRKKRGCCSVRK